MEDTPKTRRRPSAAPATEPEDQIDAGAENYAPAGHNNPPEDDGMVIAAAQLRSFIERVERLNEEMQTIREDVKEVFAEAKGTGFDVKTLRAIIKLRKMDAAERQEMEAMLDLYKAALGMA